MAYNDKYAWVSLGHFTSDALVLAERQSATHIDKSKYDADVGVGWTRNCGLHPQWRNTLFAK